MFSFYKIVVIPEGDRFRLFNEASGAPAGPRLFKGEDPKDRKQQWPFKKEADGMTYGTHTAASEAAKKLQAYLEARGRQKTRKNSNFVEKRR